MQETTQRGRELFKKVLKVSLFNINPSRVTSDKKLKIQVETPKEGSRTGEKLTANMEEAKTKPLKTSPPEK